MKTSCFTYTVCKHCWLICYEIDMGPEIPTATADKNFAWICKQHQDLIGSVLIFRTKIIWSGPEFGLVRCGYLNAAIMTIVWPWSFQQHGVTMTWHCFDWKKSLSERQRPLSEYIFVIAHRFNFHAHNYILSCFEYVWQWNDSGHESRTHFYDCSPWSRVCWSWWPQSKAWLTMVL